MAGRHPRIALAPPRSYGEFDWYDITRIDLPISIAAVVCDGPPSMTRGGRYGLLPVLRSRLGGAVILLDDADRPGEADVLDRWQTEFGCGVEMERDGIGRA